MSEQQDMNALVADLRESLLTPAKRIPATQADGVSRRVNLLAVQYANLQDDLSALECVALIGLAQIKGNKEAAKKSLKFARWAEMAPPLLERLKTDLERRGVVKQFSSFRAPWVSTYIGKALCVDQQERELTTDLVAWAFSASESAADFQFTIAGAISNGLGGNAARLNLARKLALKCLAGNRIVAGEHYPEAFAFLVSVLKNAIPTFSITVKDATALQVFAIEIIDQITAREPALLLNQVVLQAIGSAKSIAGAWSSGSQKRLELLCGRVLSVGTLTRLAGLRDSSGEVSAIFKQAFGVLPLEKVAKRNGGQQELLKILLRGFDEASLSSELAQPQGLAGKVAALLLAWNGVSGKLADKTDFAEVELQIGAIARSVSVEQFGMCGERKVYHPLEHDLVERDGEIPESVKIEVPGARVMREDGSYRILIKAIVSKS